MILFTICSVHTHVQPVYILLDSTLICVPYPLFAFVLVRVFALVRTTSDPVPYRISPGLSSGPRVQRKRLYFM